MFHCHGSRLEAAFASDDSKKTKQSGGESLMRDFVTSQLKTHLQSLYRWGVLIDHKDIELTLGRFLS